MRAPSPLGLSEARRGSAVFTNMLIDTDPPRGHPPWSDNSEKVIQHNHKAQGRFGGTGTVPSVKLMLYNLLKN